MGKIALFDRDTTFAGALALACKPHGLSICTKRTGAAGKDLVVWNLSQYPCNVEDLLADLRRGKSTPGLIVVWDGESCKPAGLAALKAGAVAALSKEAGERPILEAVRRYFAGQARRRGEDVLVNDLIDHSYTISYVNELLEALNRCAGLDDLARLALAPLQEAAGAPRGQIRLAGWGPETPPDFAEDCWQELRAKAHEERTYQWRLEGRTYIATFPLEAHGLPVGEVWLGGEPSGLDRLIDASQLIGSLCGQVAMAAVNLRYLEEVKQQALRDGLTGLYNHAFFQERLREEADRARRYQGGFSVVLFDVDHFKRINDQHGHQTGDQVLRAVAAVLRDTLRQSDMAARYGGEEFVALLPEADADGARRTAERLREAIRALNIRTLDGDPIGTVTASFGIATIEGEGESPDKLIQRADQALYRAKNAGRDRVCEAPSSGAEPVLPKVDGTQLVLSIQPPAEVLPVLEPALMVPSGVGSAERALERAKHDFLANASHELRTPLAAIVGFAELLEDGLGGPLSEQGRDFVSRIQEGADRLQSLIDTMLDFARDDKPALKVEPEETDACKLVAAVVERFRPRAREAGLELLACCPGALPIQLDREKVEQALAFMVDNAIKFTPRGGHVSVSVFQLEDFVRFEVVDDGIGMPPAHKVRAFERFYQADPTSTRAQPGAGLGLYAAKVIVEAHGGVVDVETGFGEGSTFWFALPQ